MIKEISAVEAFNKLQNKDVILVDVRTDAEFAFVGKTDLSSLNKEAICLPWKIFPSMNLNPRFQMMLEKALAQEIDEPRKAELIFMCRSGARSFEAARFMAEFGYENCYNLTSGFEGDIDQNGHRGNINGWKASNLPWRQ